MRNGLVGLMVVGALLLPACSDDGDDEAASEATTSTTATTAATAAPADLSTSAPTGPESGRCAFPANSPSTYDPKGGMYATHLTAVEVEARRLTFDVIQFLTGGEANTAYHKENPDDPGDVPNDYYIVNENRALRQASVSPTVHVQLIRLEENGPDPDPGTFEELPAYGKADADGYSKFQSNPFWIKVTDSAVTEICEQFLP